MAGTAAGAAKARAARAAKALGAPSPAPSARKSPRDPVYRVGRRPIKHGKKTYQPGEHFPLARRMPRLESWLRTGAIVVE